MPIFISLIFCLLISLTISLDRFTLVQEINKVRSDPGAYATTIEEENFNFLRFKWILDGVTYQTDEGKNGV